MRRIHIFMRRAVIFSSALILLWLAYAYLRQRPQDLPWTQLDLQQPIGLFTGRKLAALTSDRSQCIALLKRAGITFAALKPGGSGQCAYDDAVRLGPESEAIRFQPSAVAPSCPVLAALKLWEWQVVQPAAQRYFGQQVSMVEHFGSYSCRRIYGRDAGDFSEHATADAIDVSALVLSDGTRISIVGNWTDASKRAEFLREIRDGACRLFSTVLSPDYNTAHRDHLHLDQAERGALGGRVCR